MRAATLDCTRDFGLWSLDFEFVGGSLVLALKLRATVPLLSSRA
jgi:hypothetical protein